MDEINYVAARFSSPSLPSCVSSSSTSLSSVAAVRFYRQPSLPTTRTKLSLKEQLKNHESHIEELNKQLLDIRKTLPSRNAKSKILQNYAENEISLLLEVIIIKKIKTSETNCSLNFLFLSRYVQLAT